MIRRGQVWQVWLTELHTKTGFEGSDGESLNPPQTPRMKFSLSLSLFSPSFLIFLFFFCSFNPVLFCVHLLFVEDKLSPSRNIDFSDFLRTSSNSPALTTSGGALTLSDGWNAPPPQEWQAFLEQMKSGVPPGIVLTSSQLMNLENSELSLSASPSITASPSSLQVDEGSFQPQTSYGAGKEKLKLDQETVKKEDQEDRSALRDKFFFLFFTCLFNVISFSFCIVFFFF